MPRRQERDRGLTDARVVGDAPPREIPGSIDDGPGFYQPSWPFRRALGRVARREGGTAEAEASSERSAPTLPLPVSTIAAQIPGLAPVIGTAMVVGVSAGFLELLVMGTQIHILQRVGMGTLRISRHVAWMIPVAETLTTVGLATVLIAPALAWAARRRRGKAQAPSRSAAFAWEWAGLVLATLLWLGPLLAVRGLHAAAALALAIGAGFRLRRRFVRPTRGWRVASCWGGLVALGLLSCHAFVQWERVAHAGNHPLARPAPPAPNLIWIVMDTVRADRMSLYGYGRPTTPELEAWAKLGLTFEMARSAAPWTLPSHVTMFTGLWPFEHGARVDRPYSGPAPTLAEHLRSSGYATGGFVANTGMCNAVYGVGRGFDSYIDFPCNHEVSLNAAMLNSSLGARILVLMRAVGLPVVARFPEKVRRLAPEIIAEASLWLARVSPPRGGEAPRPRRPFFLFLNFMDAHGPYLPMPGAPRAFWTGPVPPRSRAVPRNGWVAVQARDSAPPEERPRRQRELDEVTGRLGDLYDDCLRGLDAELGRFLRGLRGDGLLEESWVVITADHGEHFGEHDLFGHGGSLYNELTHVPLVIIPPLGDEAAFSLRGRRIGVPVSHRDLPRTLTDLLVPGTGNPFPGRSLARQWGTGGPRTPDPILAQLEQQHLEGEDVRSDQVLKMDSLLDEDHLLIESSARGPELYHLYDDRAQRTNLAGRPAERARQGRMNRTLDTILRKAVGP